MGKRSITANDHDTFVVISGDSNPIHTDALVARRTPFGQRVVHGMHLVALALDEVAALTGRAPDSVSATFRRPVAIGADVHVAADVADDQTSARIDVTVDSISVATVSVGLTDEWTSGDVVGDPSDRSPADLDADALDGLAGTIDVAADIEALAALFPNLVTAVGPAAAAEMMSWSRLVGMRAPGKRSLFASFNMKRNVTVASRTDIEFRVSRFDDRFSLATIDVHGPAFTGTLRALLRPLPVAPDIDGVTVPATEFSAQRWLVVGGSRGLGAVAVKLLTAGGADVRFTYHTGRADADALAVDTGAAPHHLDATNLPAGLGDIVDGWAPTHLAYLASPPIFVGSDERYSATLEQRFREVYVDAFEQLVVALQPGLFAAWWPSSTALDEQPPGMAEYCAAKAAGERLCEELAMRFASLYVHAPRLPRLLTDQTASYVPVEFGDVATEVLHALRGTARPPRPPVH